MPAKTERSLIKLGESAVICIPQDWLRGEGLVPGDRVEVTYDEVLTIRPKVAKNKGDI